MTSTKSEPAITPLHSEPVTDASIERLAAELAEHLQQGQLSITTAESCTGGLIAAELTSLAGSSAYFNSGIVSYSNEAKRRLLDVPASALAAHGAVSAPVVEAMARGACQRENADIAIAVSGIAGPSGGSAEKPVGTVWLGWSFLRDGKRCVDSEVFCFSGDRTAVRQAAVFEALRGTIVRLENS